MDAFEWCWNALTIQGNETDISRFIFANLGEFLILDFKKTVPIPEGKHSGEEVWGCDGADGDVEISLKSNEKVVYIFYTNSTPPIKWLLAVSKLFPELIFDLDYENESNKECAGEIAVVDGEIVFGKKEVSEYLVPGRESKPCI